MTRPLALPGAGDYDDTMEYSGWHE